LAASNFAHNFESTYGPTHPTFLECGFQDALRKARTDFKFLLVYLHSTLHDDTPAYCAGVLTSPMVADFINDNFLMWAGDLTVSEPYRVSALLSACRFPFIGVLSNVEGNPAIIERIEGTSQLLEINNSLILCFAQSKSHARNHGILILVDRADGARGTVEKVGYHTRDARPGAHRCACLSVRFISQT
jgi:hypothetical protein